MTRVIFLLLSLSLTLAISTPGHAAPDQPPSSDSLFPSLAWTDFYGIEHSPAIPDAVRSFMIAKQVCHFFSTIYSNRFSEMEQRYIDANIAENCPGLDARETRLKSEFSDNPVALSAIRRQIEALERSQP